MNLDILREVVANMDACGLPVEFISGAYTAALEDLEVYELMLLWYTEPSLRERELILIDIDRLIA